MSDYAAGIYIFNPEHREMTMIKKNKAQAENALLLECREENPTLQKKRSKKNVKYVVFMPGKNAWPQLQPQAHNDDSDSDFNPVRLTTADTVFDNNYYAPLLMQRKYIID